MDNPWVYLPRDVEHTSPTPSRQRSPTRPTVSRSALLQRHRPGRDRDGSLNVIRNLQSLCNRVLSVAKAVAVIHICGSSGRQFCSALSLFIIAMLDQRNITAMTVLSLGLLGYLLLMFSRGNGERRTWKVSAVPTPLGTAASKL